MDYVEGIQKNLDAINKLYGKDWTARVYYKLEQNSNEMKKLCEIVCNKSNTNLDICNVDKNPRFGKDLRNNLVSQSS